MFLKCQSQLTPCHGKCAHPQWQDNCNRCRLGRNSYLCNGFCQKIDTPCNGRCPQFDGGFSTIFSASDLQLELRIYVNVNNMFIYLSHWQYWNLLLQIKSWIRYNRVGVVQVPNDVLFLFLSTEKLPHLPKGNKVFFCPHLFCKKKLA